MVLHIKRNLNIFTIRLFNFSWQHTKNSLVVRTMDFKLVGQDSIPDEVMNVFAIMHWLPKNRKVLCKNPLWYFRRGFYLEKLYLEPLKVPAERWTKPLLRSIFLKGNVICIMQNLYIDSPRAVPKYATILALIFFIPNWRSGHRVWYYILIPQCWKCV